jgi:uncharacterized membrane protein
MMDASRVVGIAIAGIGIGLVLAADWRALPRKVRIVAGVVGVLWGLALVIDGFFALRLSPVRWELTGLSIAVFGVRSLFRLRREPGPTEQARQPDAFTVGD